METSEEEPHGVSHRASVALLPSTTCWDTIGRQHY